MEKFALRGIHVCVHENFDEKSSDSSWEMFFNEKNLEKETNNFQGPEDRGQQKVRLEKVSPYLSSETVLLRSKSASIKNGHFDVVLVGYSEKKPENTVLFSWSYFGYGRHFSRRTFLLTFWASRRFLLKLLEIVSI
jgi:hypothetical protein